MSILDTRDLQTRLEELQDKEDRIDNAYEARKEFGKSASSEKEDLEDAYKEICDAEADFSEDEREELDELKLMSEEISEWMHGESLIPVDEFEEYCKELVADDGHLPKDLPAYIENNIDWSGVASDLAYDYSEVTYQGEQYYYRNC
jgi:chromosome segregation ATPase